MPDDTGPSESTLGGRIRGEHLTHCRFGRSSDFIGGETWVFTSFWQIQKGANSARADDTKSLKSAVLDWITPRGQPLRPPLARNVKTDRGFHHERTGALLCPAGLNWSDSESVLDS